MNAKTFFSLLCCACVCAGCADGELGMTHQECEQRMIGKYELSVPRPESDLMPYKDLEIMSNNVFSCSCRVNGEWVRVLGKWELNGYNRVTQKREPLSPTSKPPYRISFSYLLDEKTGKKVHYSLPFQVSKDTGYVNIVFDGDKWINFEKKPRL